MGARASKAFNDFRKLFYDPQPTSKDIAKVVEFFCTSAIRTDELCAGIPSSALKKCMDDGYKDCKQIVDAGVRQFCNQGNWNYAACNWLPKPTTRRPITRRITRRLTTTTTTTTLAPATTIISDSSSDSSSNLPLVIVAVITVLAFIAIGISLFCYCKKKKATGKKEPMTGVTTGSNSASGTSAKGATTSGKSRSGTRTTKTSKAGNKAKKASTKTFRGY